MKVATWNVNSIRARLPRVLAWIETAAPDVLCLQETKVEDAAFPREELCARGYELAIYGQKTYNGVAILSRQPIADIACGLGIDPEGGEARLIAGTTFGVRVISAYFPNGREVGSVHYQRKLAWMAALRDYFARDHEPGEAIVLCGDFNVAPGDLDVHDPVAWAGKNLCSEPEREALAALSAWGFSDLFRTVQPEGGFYSWWDYRQLGFPKNRGLRIDHIFATASLRERCEGVVIDREARKGKLPSDHAPVIATFRDPE
ncbi:MAG TPA: exodeoxyribonuclease III [Kofleriaceae bacterium]|nr:exodeoxyribonuclease III [Kofleriaceae bacterium]